MCTRANLHFERLYVDAFRNSRGHPSCATCLPRPQLRVSFRPRKCIALRLLSRLCSLGHFANNCTNLHTENRKSAHLSDSNDLLHSIFPKAFMRHGESSIGSFPPSHSPVTECIQWSCSVAAILTYQGRCSPEMKPLPFCATAGRLDAISWSIVTRLELATYCLITYTYTILNT